MCGIAGIYNSRNIKGSREVVLKMLGEMKYRGPDGKSIKKNANCVIGHLRLSIVDLLTGNQPMQSPISKKIIVFNGEIYGFTEIKKKLIDFPFKTDSDTEVILGLYEKYGEKMLEHLPGMFSFAIYNPDSDELFAARDRFGEKPFFYAIGKNGEFIFASEIKAILASNLIDSEIDYSSVAHYFRHLYVHPKKTIYKNIFVLPPGHCIKINKDGYFVKKYWQASKPLLNITFEDAKEQLHKLLERSVKNQLVADVPVGILLSGGIDSSVVTAIASKYKNKLKTFSFGFEDNLNELPYAREVAKTFGTDHIEIQEKDLDIAKILRELSFYYDEPFADSSNVPTYIIARETKKYCTVALGGDGGDELLLGYGWYKPFISDKYVNVSFKFLELLSKMSGGGVNLLHKLQNQYFSDLELSILGIPCERLDLNMINADSLDMAVQTQLLDIQDYMPGDILVKTDRASMANSLELRAPFLDRDVAEFCLALPTEYKYKDGCSKYILKEIMKELLPKKILMRGKQGFGSPVKKWMRRKDVRMLINELVATNNMNVYKILNKNIVNLYLKMDNYKGWIMLNFVLWAENYA